MSDENETTVDDGAPARNATAAEWQDFARSRGVLDAGGLTRKEIQDRYDSGTLQGEPVVDDPDIALVKGAQQYAESQTYAASLGADGVRVVPADWSVSSVEFTGADGQQVTVSRPGPGSAGTVVHADDADALIQLAADRGVALAKENIR